MSNREKIESLANKEELVIGCYDNLMESLSKKELDKVLDNMKYQSDTDIKIKRKNYVVEIDIVDNEVDFSVLTKEEYISRYGNERYEN